MKEPATLMHSIRQRLLAHFEKSALFAPDDPAMEAAPADSGQLLYAPVSGRIRALTRIKDPVFSSEVLGKGCDISYRFSFCGTGLFSTCKAKGFSAKA